MAVALVNGRVLTTRGFETTTVVLEGDRIVAVGAEATAAERIDLAGGNLLPGFIDTQVNGGGGVLFNDSPTVEAVAAIGAAHRTFGTTGFLPTLISDDLATVEKAIAVAATATPETNAALRTLVRNSGLDSARCEPAREAVVRAAGASSGTVLGTGLTGALRCFGTYFGSGTTRLSVDDRACRSRDALGRRPPP